MIVNIILYPHAAKPNANRGINVQRVGKVRISRCTGRPVTAMYKAHHTAMAVNIASTNPIG